MFKDPEIIKKLNGYSPVDENQKFGMGADEKGIYSLNYLGDRVNAFHTLKSNVNYTRRKFIEGKESYEEFNRIREHFKDLILDIRALMNNEPGHLIYGSWHRNSKYEN